MLLDWRRAWARAVEQPDAGAAGRLAEMLDGMGLSEEDIEVEREMLNTIIHARASCEAAIDFPEEDVPELTVDQVGRELADVRGEIERLLGGFARARTRYEGARVVLAGKPNTGKSSVLNALVGRERAIVTPVAGTTRDVVEVSVALDGGAVTLADTAGIRITDDPVEQLGVARTRAAIQDASCVLALFDASASLDDDDRMVASAIEGRPVVAAMNKSDLPARVDAEEIRRILPGPPLLAVSAATGSGLGELTATLARVVFGSSGHDQGESEIVIFRVRHRDAARRARNALAPAHNFAVCQQHYPENFWNLAYQRHPNGVTEAQYKAILARHPKAKGWGWRNMVRNPGVYARGHIRHPDHATASTLLDESVIGLAGKETAIGDSIGLAIRTLEDAGVEQGRRVLLLDIVPPGATNRNALAEAARWPDHLTLAVNVSPAQMRDDGFLRLVANALAASGVMPHRLELEITENLFIQNRTEVLALLHKLRNLGVRISLDDFGTGYSSLNYLQSFPFDKIKIDQVFVANMTKSQQSAAIVRAVIGLGKGLGLPVIAEGVETKEQLAFLTDAECDGVQGYLIGRPQPIAHYADMVGKPALMPQLDARLKIVARAG